MVSIAILACLALVALSTAINTWPILGAQGADFLRAMIGDEAVARLEMVLFQAQDRVQQVEYGLGLARPAAPWPTTARQATPTATPRSATASANPSASPAGRPSPSSTPGGAGQASGALPPTAGAPPAQPSPTAVRWPPAALKPLGSLAGEGVWSAYIQDGGGNPAAYRAFLQPDSQRPYAVVAVVAFDLQQTRLHFVLGTIEPFSPNAAPRSGKIPAADLRPGRLLVTFNGGFKATHGEFGAMADGVTALPPREEVGTLAIYQDGSVRMGLWGSEIMPSAQMAAWRQNGPLVIHNGQVNPQIFNNSPKDWGYTVNDVSPTWRSGIGLSADEKTLFYFAGSKLTMQSLAEAMLAAGAAQGLQLDINNYWVHFVVIKSQAEQLIPEPLFPEMMRENLDRYLNPYSRDFFYLTGLP